MLVMSVLLMEIYSFLSFFNDISAAASNLMIFFQMQRLLWHKM
jgi:hypothetical protein